MIVFEFMAIIWWYFTYNPLC